MKLTKVIVVLTLTVISSVFADPGCANQLNDSAIAPLDKSQIYPGDQKANKDYANALKNATTQTKAARKMFYKPKALALELITLAAKNVIAAYNKDPSGFKTFATSKLQRQTTFRGTLQTYFAAVAGNISKISDLNLPQALEKLIPAMTKPNAIDILAFLGWMGDMAAAITDTYGRIDGAKPEQKAFGEFMKKIVKNLDTQAKTLYDQYSPDKFYSGNKKTERKTCADGSNATMKLAPRAGVMDTGLDVDKDLKPEKALPTISWPWQTVPVDLPDKFCKTEPWAGHVSGSFYELVFMLQVFAQTPDERICLMQVKSMINIRMPQLLGDLPF